VAHRGRAPNLRILPASPLPRDVEHIVPVLDEEDSGSFLEGRLGDLPSPLRAARVAWQGYIVGDPVRPGSWTRRWPVLAHEDEPQLVRLVLNRCARQDAPGNVLFVPEDDRLRRLFREERVPPYVPEVLAWLLGRASYVGCRKVNTMSL
jgi:hypothetical protein